MNERQQEQAWNNEVSTTTALVEISLKSANPDLPPEDLKRDAKQAATGILLLGTLPDYALRAAMVHLRMDLKRRGLE